VPERPTETPAEFDDGCQSGVAVAALTSADDWPVQPEMSSTQATKIVHTTQQLVVQLSAGPCVQLMHTESPRQLFAELLTL
jgi:hypothetical protein